MHVTGCAVYSVVHTVVLLVARALLFPQGRPSSLAGLWKYTQMEYLGQLDWMLMTYLSLVGLAHALAYRRESEIRALDAAHLETRLVQAQLQALQRQLHPHFLFNTLNTISGLMRTNVDAADSMIDRLGDLLRMTLHTSGTQEVSLKRELDVLAEVSRDRTDTLRRSADASPSASIRKRSTRRCRTCSCSRSSKTPCVTALRRTRGRAGSRSTPSGTTLG